MVQESKAQVVYDIAGKIKEPGEDGVFFPAYRGSPVQGFSDYKERGFVAKLDNDQNLVLAGEISKQTGEEWMLLLLGRTIEEAYSNAEFRRMLETYWIHNDERILEDGHVQINNRATVKEGSIVVEGERRAATVNRKSVIDTLVSAHVMERMEEKIIDRGIHKFEDGVASVRSGSVGERGLDADAYWPSFRRGDGVVAFVRVPKKTKGKKAENREFR